MSHITTAVHANISHYKSSMDVLDKTFEKEKNVIFAGPVLDSDLQARTADQVREAYFD